MTTRAESYPKGFTLPYGNPSDATLDALQAAHCKVVRVGYPEIENMLATPAGGSAGAFSTTALSTLIQRVFDRDMDLHFSQLGVPVQVNASAGTGGNWKYHATNSGGRTQMAGYATSIATAMAAKMTANPGRTCYYEVNQEPNIIATNPGGQSYTAIGLEALACYQAVAAVSSDIILIGPSFANRGDWSSPVMSDVGHTGPAALADMFSNVSGLGAGLLHYQGYHPYIGSSDPSHNDPWAMGQLLAVIFELQVTQGATSALGGTLKIAPTEWGLKRNGTESGFTYNEANQTSRMVTFLGRTQALRDSNNIGGPDEYYTFQGDGPTFSKAIFKSDGTPYGAGVIWQLDAVQSITVATPPPTAAFSVTPPWGQNAGTAVHFTDTSTHSPTSWHWDFGDGGTSTSQNPNHTYSAPGIYDVEFIATNAHGSDTITFSYPVNSVYVDPPPPGDGTDVPVVLIELGIPTNARTDLDTWVIGDDTRGDTNGSWTVAHRYHWYEITDDLVSYQTKRGRETPLDRTPVGTASVTVRNDNPASAAQYDNRNWNSPYFPSLRASEARLRISIDGSGVFCGPLSGAPVTDEVGDLSTTTFNAVDFLSLLNVPIRYKPEAVHTAGKRMARLGERAGVWQGSEQVVFSGRMPHFLFTGFNGYAAGTVFTDTALSLMMDVAFAEGGMLYAASSPGGDPGVGGSINFIDRDHMAAAPPLMTFTDGPENGASVIQYTGPLVRDDGDDLIYNAVTFKTVDGDEISATDPRSIQTYGGQPRRISDFNSPIGGTSRAYTKVLNQLRVDELVRDFKDAAPRFPTVLIEAHRYTATQRRNYITGQEIGHVCQLIRTPPGGGFYVPSADVDGSSISEIQVIEGMAISGSPGICNVEFTMSYQLESTV